ncbi:MAG: hypothetical protein L7U62_00930 [Candidatus Poseidoniaceae archaeon]|nr:hypothetical protein [Candidatus Poseidoniaceae archaeon]
MSAHARVGSITITLLFPLFLFILSSPVAVNAQAADACVGDTTPVEWNTTVQRSSMVPFHDDMWWDDYIYYDEMENDGDDEFSSGSSPQSSTQVAYDPELNPEEAWMYESYYMPRLEPLEVNHFTTMLIGNDSVGALRVNLSADYRTTICITLQDTSFNPVDADVYLFTSQEYSRYQDSYRSNHGNNPWYDDEGGLEESLSDIPPEWRSFNFLGWKSFRDSHEYEKTSEVNFALNLDGPEMYSSFFSGENWEDFYIVIDTWDNVHDFDAPPPNTIVAADVTIITTERSFILPPFTVALVFLAGFLGTLVLPFVLNARYMKAGLAPKDDKESIVPSLEGTPSSHAQYEQLSVAKEMRQPVPIPEQNDAERVMLDENKSETIDHPSEA